MTTRLSVRLLPGWADPADIFLGGPAGSDGGFWLDAGPRAREGWSRIGVGLIDVSGPGDTDVSPADAAAALPHGAVAGWIGWLDYDAAAARAGSPSAPDTAVGGTRWLRADRFVAFDHVARRMWACAPEAELETFCLEVAAWRTAPASAPHVPPPGSRGVHARHTPVAYAALVEQCRAAIREGDAYQLCLTTRFEVTASAHPIDPVTTYLALRELVGAHHSGFIRCGDVALLSASPERFIEVAAGTVRTRPIKGTRPREADAVADAARAEELRTSPKERAENVMIVDLMRNDLQRVCAPGTVVTEGLLEVEPYLAVHQLVSTVSGRLLAGTTFDGLLAAVFPAGSMTGAPKLSAMTILHGLERGPRGVFAGCFGWVGDDGGVDLAMTIRSIVVHPGGAYVGAGGGITWHSDAGAEVAEVGVKARGPLAALGAALPPGW